MAGEIQLNSTTMATESSGSITLSNVDSATNRTNLGLGSIATQAADSVSITGGTIGSSVVFPTGHIIQITQNQFTTQPSRTSSSFGAFSSTVGHTITGCTTGSDIYITVHLTIGQTSTSERQNYFRLIDKTNSNAVIGTEGTDALFGFQHISQGGHAQISYSILYTPPSFSSGSFEVELYAKNAFSETIYLNRRGLDASYGRQSCNIILMEVAG